MRPEAGPPDPSEKPVPFEDFPAETNPPLLDRPPRRAHEGVSDRRDVEVRPRRVGPSKAAVARIAAAAAEHRQVRRALGRRSVEIGVRASSTKEGGEAVAVFYSYAHQWTVEAVIDRANEVTEVRTSRIQPPLTTSELESSIALAERAIGRETRGLARGAIAVSPEEPEDPLAGRRLADVRFFAEDRRLPRFQALVDVADRRVITSGPVEEEVQRG